MTDPAALLRALAVPRLAGSEGHSAVRDRLKQELAARGYTVQEQRFTASDAPLRRVAFAAELAALAALAFIIGALAGDPVRGVRIAALPLVALAAVLLVRRHAGQKTWGVNLVARPAGRPPQVWLTAHYDSKGQQISMATRLCGVACLVLQAPAAALLAGVWAAGERGPWLAALALPALAGGVLLSRADLRNDCPGAVDNASGVVAALTTVDRLPGNADVGIVFTDAEEWGLQGARALVHEHAQIFREAVVINFDGIDDAGTTLLLAHRPGPLAAKLAREGDVRRVRWLPVLVDGMALARASRECMTLMRGTWGTMRRVHTPRDDAGRLALDGVRRLAAAVADALQSA